MIKVFLLLISVGLSTLTTLLIDPSKEWLVAIGIIGFTIAYILLIFVLFFLSAFLISLPLKKNKTPQHYNGKYRKIYNIYLHFGMSFLGGYIVANGLNKIPSDTNFVLVQNHRSNLDPMLLDIVLKDKPLVFIGKESLFNIPFWGKIITAAGYIKVKRVPCFEDAKEMVRGMKMLENNECSIAIYPEQQRNKTYPSPKLLELKEGAFALAKKTNRPIVISLVHDSEKANKLLLLKPHRVQFDFVDVIYPEEYNKISTPELIEQVSSIMLDAIDNPSQKEEYKKLL